MRPGDATRFGGIVGFGGAVWIGPVLATLIIAPIFAACEASERQTDEGDPPNRALLLQPGDPAWEEPAPPEFHAIFETSAGRFVIAVQRSWAPRGADRFYNLVRHGFYDDSRFYRVVEDFIVQFGLPGDPEVTPVWLDRTLTDDPVLESNLRGRITYATTGPDTRATQVYINLIDNVRLDSTGFAPFGEVVEGMDVVDRLYAGYGENAGGGMRRGEQGRIIAEGNAHLDRDFPLLDQIISARIAF
jgi:homoserine O-acetyltransferase